MEVRFEGVPAPERKHHNDAAYDLKAAVAVSIAPGEVARIRTGLHLAIPDGFVGMVCSRSGLALNQSVFVLNAPGIVDPGYRGDVSVILFNAGETYFDVHPGDRIAQLMFVRAEHPQFVFGILGAESERGSAGFGSTGIA